MDGHSNGHSPDFWRDRVPLFLAVAASTAWIVLVAFYLRRLPGGLTSLSPGEAAGFFAGAAGPLAALWLFLAVVEQRRRLSMMTHALGEILGQHRHGLQLAESQTRTLMEFQAQAKRGQEAQTRHFALQDLAGSVAVLAERLGVLRREDVDVTWARFGSGDVTAFVQPFLSFAVSHPEISERLADAVRRDPLAAAALQSFVRRYERLTASLGEDRLVLEIIDEGAMGRAYRLFRAAADTAAKPIGAEVPPPPAPLPPRPQSDLFPADTLEARLTELSKRLD